MYSHLFPPDPVLLHRIEKRAERRQRFRDRRNRCVVGTRRTALNRNEIPKSEAFKKISRRNISGRTQPAERQSLASFDVNSIVSGGFSRSQLQRNLFSLLLLIHRGEPATDYVKMKCLTMNKKVIKTALVSG